MSTMTWEKIRDHHLGKVAYYTDEKYPRAIQRHQAMADFITAHLAQPAQAVDVGAIRDVIDRLRINPSITAQECADSLAVALSGEKAVLVDEPDVALLASMATCLNHGFGLLDASQQQSMLHDMRKLWDEVMGRGYYRPDNRERYMPMLVSPAPDKEGM